MLENGVTQWFLESAEFCVNAGGVVISNGSTSSPQVFGPFVAFRTTIRHFLVFSARFILQYFTDKQLSMGNFYKIICDKIMKNSFLLGGWKWFCRPWFCKNSLVAASPRWVFCGQYFCRSLSVSSFSEAKSTFDYVSGPMVGTRCGVRRKRRAIFLRQRSRVSFATDFLAISKGQLGRLALSGFRPRGTSALQTHRL